MNRPVAVCVSHEPPWAAVVVNADPKIFRGSRMVSPRRKPLLEITFGRVTILAFAEPTSKPTNLCPANTNSTFELFARAVRPQFCVEVTSVVGKLPNNNSRS